MRAVSWLVRLWTREERMAKANGRTARVESLANTAKNDHHQEPQATIASSCCLGYYFRWPPSGLLHYTRPTFSEAFNYRPPVLCRALESRVKFWWLGFELELNVKLKLES